MDQISPNLATLLGNAEAYEDIILRLGRALLQPGDLALDGGAGRGRNTFSMAAAVGAEGRVLACEPIGWLAERLGLDAGLRQLPQVAVHAAALAEAPGEADFHWVRNADAYSGLQPRAYPVAPDTALVPVACTTIDALLAGETRRWRFAKLDLQGGELAALRGGATAIAAHRPVLVFLNPREAAAAAYGYDAAAFFRFFAGLGYRVFDLFGRPFGPGDWDRQDVPWYGIAVAAGSSAELMLRDMLGPILLEAAHRANDPGLDDLEPWLAQQPSNEYLETHRLRYLETWKRAAPALMPAQEVVELGGASVIGRFLDQRRGADLRLIESDLRYPYASLDESADAVLSLEVLEHLNEALQPTSAIEEIALFQQSGAACMFRESFRILRPGGCLVVTTPNITSLDSIGNLLRKRHAFNYPPHVREYAPADVVALAEASGFVAEVVETFRAWNSMPDVDAVALVEALRALGFDMTDRENDAYFLFRKPGPGSSGGAPPEPNGVDPAPLPDRQPLPPVHVSDNRAVEAARLFALQGSHALFDDVIAGLCAAVLRPGDLAVDGGAGHGRHSYRMAELVGPTGRVLAIEPVPALADALRAGAARRGLPQLEHQQVALSDCEGQAMFYQARHADGRSGLQVGDRPIEPDHEALPVRVARLDTLLDDAAQPLRLIKLDLGGGGFHALMGAEQRLAGSQPVILLEDPRQDAARLYGFDRYDYFGFFDRMGYRLYDLFGRPFRLEGWDDPGHPDCLIGVPADGTEASLVTIALPRIIGDAVARFD